MHKEDISGYWIFPDTPITREGVYPYKGKQIDSDGSMGLDPERKYPVYRPRSEISKPEVLDSFNGVFLTDEHEMLGAGERDPGTKPIAGSVYNVHVDPNDPGTILATLKVQSEKVKNLIQSGKRALSCGYYCDYRPAKGTFRGQPYEFIQCDLCGNHIALVRKGRMGEKCALDSAGEMHAGAHASRYACDAADLTEALLNLEFAKHGRMESQVRDGKKRKIACDSAIDIDQRKVTFMPKEDTNYDEMLATALRGKGVMDKANIDKIIEFISTLPATPEAVNDGVPEPATPQEPAAPPAPAPTEPPATDGDDPAAPVAEPPAPKTLTEEEFKAAVDAQVNERLNKLEAGRKLAEDIAPRCGNLWKKGMDADDVAAAACEKMGHGDLPKEARIPFVKAMASEAKNDEGNRNRGTGMDSAADLGVGAMSSTLSKYLGK